ncbi:hypothetical protein OHV13_32540 [Kitasatospora purpeofusca]|uniref:hypothetical protein n=1 Tax=Kitasatospora purpeofusca TaxID=67352 RepID=UPI003247366B
MTIAAVALGDGTAAAPALAATLIPGRRALAGRPADVIGVREQPQPQPPPGRR